MIKLLESSYNSYTFNKVFRSGFDSTRLDSSSFPNWKGRFLLIYQDQELIGIFKFKYNFSFYSVTIWKKRKNLIIRPYRMGYKEYAFRKAYSYFICDYNELEAIPFYKDIVQPLLFARSL